MKLQNTAVLFRCLEFNLSCIPKRMGDFIIMWFSSTVTWVKRTEEKEQNKNV